MNIDYLYSIINLYLRNEKDSHRTNLIVRKLDQQIEFSFNMNENDPNKTSLILLEEDINPEMNKILNLYKQSTIIINERYTKDSNYYQVFFQNGRILSFKNFSLMEINCIRNILYNITIDSEEMRISDLDVKKKMAYKPSLLLQQAGFMSNSNIFLIVLYLVDIFVIALWIFKELTK